VASLTPSAPRDSFYYRRVFLFLVLLWREGELFGRAGTLFCVWFLLAAVTQLFAPSTAVWILGLLTQLALAIVLVLKEQLSDIR
jgi:hypothetical protein